MHLQARLLCHFTIQFVEHRDINVFLLLMTDEVDLRTSFPLSRFVKNLAVFTVDFAVQGAESKSKVRLVNFSKFEAS